LTVGAAAVVAGRGGGGRELRIQPPEPLVMPTSSLLPEEIPLQLAAANTDGEPVATEKAVRSLAVKVALEVRPMGGDGEGAVSRSR